MFFEKEFEKNKFPEEILNEIFIALKIHAIHTHTHTEARRANDFDFIHVC